MVTIRNGYWIPIWGLILSQVTFVPFSLAIPAQQSLDNNIDNKTTSRKIEQTKTVKDDDNRQNNDLIDVEKMSSTLASAKTLADKEVNVLNQKLNEKVNETLNGKLNKPLDENLNGTLKEDLPKVIDEKQQIEGFKSETPRDEHFSTKHVVEPTEEYYKNQSSDHRDEDYVLTDNSLPDVDYYTNFGEKAEEEALNSFSDIDLPADSNMSTAQRFKKTFTDNYENGLQRPQNTKHSSSTTDRQYSTPVYNSKSSFSEQEPSPAVDDSITYPQDDSRYPKNYSPIDSADWLLSNNLRPSFTSGFSPLTFRRLLIPSSIFDDNRYGGTSSSEEDVFSYFPSGRNVFPFSTATDRPFIPDIDKTVENVIAAGKLKLVDVQRENIGKPDEATKLVYKSDPNDKTFKGFAEFHYTPMKTTTTWSNRPNIFDSITSMFNGFESPFATFRRGFNNF